MTGAAEKLFIAGNWVAGPTETIRSIDPATLESLGEVPVAGRAEVDRAVAAAREAFPRWRDTPLRERARYLLEMRRVLLAEKDRVADLLVREVGKPRAEAFSTEIVVALDLLGYFAREAANVLADEPIRLSNPFLLGKRGYVAYEPLGVYAVIAPWNFPFSISISSVIAPLVAGNTVVYKPSEVTPLIGLEVARLAEKAGLPPGVFNCVTGGRETGAFLVDSDVAGVVFTGSVAAGKAIMAASAPRLHRLTLELGGKDAFIVLDDAPVAWTARGAVWSALVNCGQVCASAERFLVDRRVAAAFTEAVVAETRKLKVGLPSDPATQIGPLASEAQRGKVEALVADAVGRGARLLAGGRRVEGLAGWFHEPTVLAGITSEMRIWEEETFGPVICIREVADEEEAVRLANRSRYGLSASVWTADPRRGEALARRLECGSVWVNDSLYSYGAPMCPWGGVKESGFGRTHGAASLREFTNVKYISVERPSRMPRPWWFPYTDSYLGLLRGACPALYGRGLERARALPATIGSAIRRMRGI